MNKFVKKAAVISMLAAAVFAVSACGEKKNVSITEKSSFEQKSAYSIGASVGMYIKNMLDQQAELIDPMDQEIVLKGVADALKGGNALKNKDMEDTLHALDQKLKEAMQAKQAALAKKNLEEGEKFLSENKTKEGVQVPPSGLQYKIITKGDGETAKKGDTVTVTYKGTTIDGKIFDEQREGVDFPLDNMIPGWIEGIELMTEGSEYEFYIPANLAYGEAGAGDAIAPNSVLIFDVKLSSVKKAAPKAEAGSAPEAANEQAAPEAAEK